MSWKEGRSGQSVTLFTILMFEGNEEIRGKQVTDAVDLSPRTLCVQSRCANRLTASSVCVRRFKYVVQSF